MDKFRWNEAYPHKLVATWMSMILTFYFIIFDSWISWLGLTIASKNAIVIQNTYLHNNLPFFWAKFHIFIYTFYWKLMKLVGSHNNEWLLLFIMKVII
jgi:hypothetical protein